MDELPADLPHVPMDTILPPACALEVGKRYESRAAWRRLFHCEDEGAPTMRPVTIQHLLTLSAAYWGCRFARAVPDLPP